MKRRGLGSRVVVIGLVWAVVASVFTVVTAAPASASSYPICDETKPVVYGVDVAGFPFVRCDSPPTGDAFATVHITYGRLHIGQGTPPAPFSGLSPDSSFESMDHDLIPPIFHAFVKSGGFDVTNSETIDDIWGNFRTTNLMAFQAGITEGVDVDWSNGVGNLFVNSEVYQTLLTALGHAREPIGNQSAPPLLVMGPSMGGVLAKDAIRKMELDGNRAVGHAILVDAPQWGAWVPPAIQSMADFVDDPSVAEVAQVLASDAARQMLLAHVNTAPYEPDPMFAEWMANVDEVGFPEHAFVSVTSNGACSGQRQAGYGQEIMRHDARAQRIIWPVLLIPFLPSVPLNLRLTIDTGFRDDDVLNGTGNYLDARAEVRLGGVKIKEVFVERPFNYGAAEVVWMVIDADSGEYLRRDNGNIIHVTEENVEEIGQMVEATPGNWEIEVNVISSGWEIGNSAGGNADWADFVEIAMEQTGQDIDELFLGGVRAEAEEAFDEMEGLEGVVADTISWWLKVPGSGLETLTPYSSPSGAGAFIPMVSALGLDVHGESPLPPEDRTYHINVDDFGRDRIMEITGADAIYCEPGQSTGHVYDSEEDDGSDPDMDGITVTPEGLPDEVRVPTATTRGAVEAAIGRALLETPDDAPLTDGVYAQWGYPAGELESGLPVVEIVHPVLEMFNLNDEPVNVSELVLPDGLVCDDLPTPATIGANGSLSVDCEYASGTALDGDVQVVVGHGDQGANRWVHPDLTVSLPSPPTDPAEVEIGVDVVALVNGPALPGGQSPVTITVTNTSSIAQEVLVLTSCDPNSFTVSLDAGETHVVECDVSMSEGQAGGSAQTVPPDNSAYEAAYDTDIVPLIEAVPGVDLVLKNGIDDPYWLEGPATVHIQVTNTGNMAGSVEVVTSFCGDFTLDELAVGATASQWCTVDGEHELMLAAHARLSLSPELFAVDSESLAVSIRKPVAGFVQASEGDFEWIPEPDDGSGGLGGEGGDPQCLDGVLTSRDCETDTRDDRDPCAATDVTYEGSALKMLVPDDEPVRTEDGAGGCAGTDVKAATVESGDMVEGEVELLTNTVEVAR